MRNFRIMPNWVRCVLAIGLVLPVAACSTAPEPAKAPIANGAWASSDGIYRAEFNNGTFRSVANDTGEVLSQGNYTVNSETSLQISWRGNVSGKFNSAKCTKPDVNTMNCVDESGKSFSLLRTN